MEDEYELLNYLEATSQMDLPIKSFKEITNVILTEISLKAAPGFDLITGKTLQEFTPMCILKNTFYFCSTPGFSVPTSNVINTYLSQTHLDDHYTCESFIRTSNKF